MPPEMIGGEMSTACYNRNCHWCRNKYCECECHDEEDDIDRDWWHQDEQEY